MKPHKILKTFPGSQTGHDHDVFEKGTVRDLSDGLAEVVVKAGWAVPHVEDGEEASENAADTSEEGDQHDEGEKAVTEAPENKMRKPVKGKKAA
jgi:hypothetical protein